MKTIYIKKQKVLEGLGFCLIIAAFMFFSSFVISEVKETIADNTGEKNLPIYSVETGEERKIAISFDAAWGNEDTVVIADILDEYNIKATFFLCGYWVEKYPDDVKMLYERGHDIGNHSATHPDMTTLSDVQREQEIMDVHNLVYELLGYEMFLFRPPYGAYDENVINSVRACEYYTIQWDVDSLDWKEYGTENEISTVLNHKNLQNGSIILFHNDTKYTPLALPVIIEGLQEQGFEIVPLSELIIQEDYYIDHAGRQFPAREDKTGI